MTLLAVDTALGTARALDDLSESFTVRRQARDPGPLCQRP
jgi:hypothetical protein